jgi:hypothetical protein
MTVLRPEIQPTDMPCASFTANMNAASPATEGERA